MEASRDTYIDNLKLRMGNGMVKVITGVRRCGKTYLLFTLFRRFLKESGIDDAHIIELALDVRENARYRDPDELDRYLANRIGDDEGPYYVLLDEVQYAVSEEELRGKGKAPLGIYDVLNGLLHRRNVDVYVTGSNSRFLSKDVMTEFRGRGDEIHVMPLSFSEFMQNYDGDRYQAWAEYMLYGGMPLLASMPTDEQKASYLSRLFDEVYLNDVIARNHVSKTQELEDVVDILASSVGSLTNPHKIAATFGSVLQSSIDEATVKRFVGYLEDAFLVTEAVRYDIKGRRYIGTPKKYYYEDVGLRNARLGFRQVEESHLMENVIFNELRMRGYGVDVGVVERRRRINGKDERTRYEVDFVANRGFRRYYIQSAFNMDTDEKREQEKRSLRLIDDSFKKIVVVKDVVRPYMDNAGVLTMGLFDFLLDPNSLDM